MKREPFFCHSNKPFCTKTFVNTAHRRQNHHYFPILCIFTQAFVDLTNNSQVFCLTLSWIFHLLAKKWFKKSHVHEFTETKKTTGCESFARGAEVRNSSCSYYLSNSSTVFTENTVNMDQSSSPASDSENSCRFFKHFCFCAPCLTVGAVPLSKLSRNRESAKVKVLYFVGSDQKCGTKFSACCASW